MLSKVGVIGPPQVRGVTIETAIKNLAAAQDATSNLLVAVNNELIAALARIDELERQVAARR